jgi:hypothetical protein
MCVCVCVCPLFCPADTVNPKILVSRSACKPLSHDQWKEHVYWNKEKGKRTLYAWTEEKYLYIQIFSPKTWRAETTSKTDAKTGE